LKNVCGDLSNVYLNENKPAREVYEAIPKNDLKRMPGYEFQILFSPFCFIGATRRTHRQEQDRHDEHLGKRLV